MKEQAQKAFQEMMDISTDIDRAVLFAGDEVVATNFPEAVQATMIQKAKELAGLGETHSQGMGASPLTQLVVETGAGSVFLVREPREQGLAMLATGRKDSRIGLVFYDLKTCIRDARAGEEDQEVEE